jgi:hypothetical protein
MEINLVSYKGQVDILITQGENNVFSRLQTFITTKLRVIQT